VLLVYAWMTDASAWLPLSESERRNLALTCIAKMYDGRKDIDGSTIDVRDLFMESADAVWSHESATGDAMFLPGHFNSYFEVAQRPEGNIFFAGEHLSRHHTWIAGALESSLQAVRDLLEQPDVQPLSGTHPFRAPNRMLTPPPVYEALPSGQDSAKADASALALMAAKALSFHAPVSSLAKQSSRKKSADALWSTVYDAVRNSTLVSQ